ncbi:MAG: Single-stranded-DNA-specific exonuclease RecJ [Parcubacteria group bacterium GW2011_GWC1_40_13]|nr:MAG: Single-stranded-DNA-specific exonuclease RecJ [Parcubacteria group bacterium GW2011_GWC1_40_13]
MKKYSVRKEIPDSARENLESYPEILRRLLFYRGIENNDDAEKFLNPDYDSGTHDPFLMKDMDKAVERILKAIEQNEKIIIYSDYDADGIPGAVVLHDFFKKIGFNNFENYIPHRHEEGFGLNMEAVEEFGKSGAKLLITIDCGIADVKEVERLNELGIDVIITDHHELGEKIPPAYAILNSKQTECFYPEKMLCGAGVVFKLVQALISKKNIDWQLKEGAEKWFLDMVGLATLSDMVPLTGENRVFAYYGLKVLRKSPRVGLMKLLRKIKVEQKNITEDDIGFTITPRINAASRMDAPMDAFRLLATSDETLADELSSHLNKINDERKGLVASMVKEMKHIISSRADGAEKKEAIVMGNPKWKPSLLGLAANTLMQENFCPVFIWGREGENILKGSCRSPGNVSLINLMKSLPKGILRDYGGHSMSGGFSVSHEKIHLLEEEIISALKKIKIESGEFSQEIFIDKKLFVDDVNWETYNILEKLAPFGAGNPKPLFLFEKIEIASVKNFGKEKNHLEISFRKEDGKNISAIGFFMKGDEWGIELKEGEKINLVATMEKSMFRNFPELRLRIVDIL